MKLVAIWSLVIGGVFLLSALGRGPLRRLPVGMPILYLLVGIGIGPWGLNLISLDFVKDAKLIEVLAEIAVLISLLTAVLRLTPSWSMYWRSPIPLASVTMVLTILGIATLAYFFVGLPLGACVLLGAVLAPTDPVLASEVQVRHEDDRDQLRFALTGEAGLNDGAAFPFIMLGLGLLGVHEIGVGGWKWFAVDFGWAVSMGLISGWVMGWLISRLSIWVKRKMEPAAACEELLTLALIGLSYGVAMAIHSYGFLAVFAAGVAMRKYVDQDNSDKHPDKTMLKVAEINEQFERIVEIALVVIIGVLLSVTFSIHRDWWIAIVLFFVIRPASVFIALFGKKLSGLQRAFSAFFGIRGIGSVYYLAYAIGKGLETDIANRLAGIVLATIAMSLLIHSNAASTALDYYMSESKDEPTSPQEA